MVQCVGRSRAVRPGRGGVRCMWAAVADHVAARIAAGELAPGARLPGEHEMATEYRVSTDTIRRAGRAAGPRPGRDAGSQSDLHSGRLTPRKVRPFVRRSYASCCTAG